MTFSIRTYAANYLIILCVIAFSRFRFRFWLLGLLILCLRAGAARAQTPTPTPKGPLQMALSSPFAFTAKPLVVTAKAGRWFPVAVNLANTGEAVSGQLRLKLLGAGNFDVAPNDFYTPVDLPSNSNKTIWLYGRMERPNVAGFEVSFSGSGFKSLQQGAQISPSDDESRLIVTIADSDDGLAATLKSLRGQALFRGGRAPQLNPNAQPVRSLQADSLNVPDRWIGFDSADMVVLGDFVHTSLAPKQLGALRGFVQGGGNLVVVGGNNAGRLSASPLKDLWPVNVGNSAPVSQNVVSGLVNRYVPDPKNGADRLGGAPVVAVQGSLDAADTLSDGTPSAPLFALGDRGAGRVLFLSYNPGQPPFVGWSGQGELWRNVFSSAVNVRHLESVDSDFLNYGSVAPGGFATTPYGGNPYANGEQGPTSTTGQLLSGLSSAPQLRMPPVSQIAWFLALYVFFLVPVNYAVLRVIDRRELAWVTIPLIVIGFSVWAYSAALSIRGRAILTRQIDIVQTTVGSNSARTDSMLWLFSPRRTSYDLVSGGQNAAVSDYANQGGGQQGAFSVLQPGDGDSFKVEGANVWMWTDRAFSAQSLADLGKGLNLSGQTLTNDTPLDLKGAVWVQDGKVWGLGDLDRGAKVAVKGAGQSTSGADLPGAIAAAADLPSIFDSSTLSNSIPAKALESALGQGFGKLNNGAMLVAWGKKSVAPLSVEGARGRDVTLWIIRAPKVTGALASRKATITSVSFVPFSAQSAPNYQSRFGQATNGGYKFYDATLPQQSDLVLQARGIGNSNGQNQGRRQRNAKSQTKPKVAAPVDWVHFEVWNAATNAWQPLEGAMKRDNSPAGGWNFRGRVDASLARQPDRLLRVRVKLDNARAQVSSLQIG